MSRRTIAVITATRAEYGLLSRILTGIAAHPKLDLALVVTGQHLMREFGMTVREIERDGHVIAARVPMRLRGDSGLDIARAMGGLVGGFASALAAIEPDLMLVLGDRYEILAAASAALPLRVPVAHIHGGESTAGAIDDQIRHAVTKLSHLHFPVTDPYRERIIAMGERPDRVFQLGAPGIDNLEHATFRSRRDLFEALRLPVDARVGVVTVHPETLGASSTTQLARAVFAALDATPDVVWACTHPGADPGYRAIKSTLERYARRAPARFRSFVSLGRDYPSLMRHAALMVGNSSSGILEAPFFSLPVVNVGRRQDGRIRARNVIDVPTSDAIAVRAAIVAALDQPRRKVANPYAARDTCARIVATLAEVALGPELLTKGAIERSSGRRKRRRRTDPTA